MDLQHNAADMEEQAVTFMIAPLLRKRHEHPNSVPATRSKRALRHENESRLFLCMMIPLVMMAMVPMMLPDILLRLHDGPLHEHRHTYETAPVPPNIAACRYAAAMFPSYSTDASLAWDFFNRTDPIIAMSRNGKTMALAASEGTSVRVYYSLDNSVWHDYDIDLSDYVKGITKLALSGDGTVLLVGERDLAALVRVSDRSVTAVPNTKQEHFVSLQSLAMNNDGSLLAITSGPRPNKVIRALYNHTALYKRTPSGSWTVQHLSINLMSHRNLMSYHMALADDALITASGRHDDILVNKRQKPSDASQPWQEHVQTIPHPCLKTRLAMAVSSNGTIVTMAVQCQSPDSDLVYLRMYALVWNDATADYQVHQSWTSQFGIWYMPPMSLTMSGDASLTILAVTDMQPFVFHGDFWNRPNEKSYMNHTLEPTSSWAMSEDASKILLARPFDHHHWRGGGVCLLKARQHPQVVSLSSSSLG